MKYLALALTLTLSCRGKAILDVDTDTDSDTDTDTGDIDGDGDGYTVADGDCDDAHSGALDTCGDGINNDCDGIIDIPDCDAYSDCYAR
jgi:hypothetical protein